MALRVAKDWYGVETLGEGVSRIHEIHVADWLRCNIWHVQGRDRDAAKPPNHSRSLSYTT